MPGGIDLGDGCAGAGVAPREHRPVLDAHYAGCAPCAGPRGGRGFAGLGRSDDDGRPPNSGEQANRWGTRSGAPSSDGRTVMRNRHRSQGRHLGYMATSTAPMPRASCLVRDLYLHPAEFSLRKVGPQGRQHEVVGVAPDPVHQMTGGQLQQRHVAGHRKLVHITIRYVPHRPHFALCVAACSSTFFRHAGGSARGSAA